MQNRWVVKNLPRLAAIKRDRDAAIRKMATLQKRAYRLDEQVRVLDQVSEIWEGAALSVRSSTGPKGRYTDITSPAEDHQRWATVFPNAYSQGTSFGVTTYAIGSNYSTGSNLPESQAIVLAKTWVAKGTYPKQGEIHE